MDGSNESSATQSRLLDAAIIEFAEKGFASATVRDICRRADANLNAVKYHFVDKHGLYVQAVQEAHRRQSPMQPPIAGATATPAEDRLFHFIKAMLSMMMMRDPKHSACHLLMLREMAEPGEATREIVRQFIEPHFRQLTNILADLTGQQLTPVQLKLLAFSVVGQCLYYRVGTSVVPLLVSEQELTEMTVDKIARHICNVTLSAANAAKV